MCRMDRSLLVGSRQNRRALIGEEEPEGETKDKLDDLRTQTSSCGGLVARIVGPLGLLLDLGPFFFLGLLDDLAQVFHPIFEGGQAGVLSIATRGLRLEAARCCRACSGWRRRWF
jgi:hypothetical protein